MVPPVRTCIGCRERAQKAWLLRLVWLDGVVVDVPQTTPGRGAYLHRDTDCLERAIRRRAAGRALRVKWVDPVALATAVTPHLDEGAVGAGETTSRKCGPVA